MPRQNFLTLTLIVSGLALSPVLAYSEFNRVSYSQTIDQYITSSIAHILQKRGIDKDAADALAENIVDEEDEMFLAMIIQHLEKQNIVTAEEILTYFSQAALHKQKFDVKSYDHLIGMVAKIKQKPLDESTRKKLSQIAQLNSYFS